MALLIEDGSGISDALSYVSADDATVFFQARGLSAISEAYLLQAMDILEGLVYVGTPTVIGQGLSFPRMNIVNAYNVPYGENEIPQALINAQMWLSYYIELGFSPSAVATAAIKREKADVVEIEYFGDGDTANTADKINYGIGDLPNVISFLGHLLLDSDLSDSDTDSFTNGRSDRA